MNRETGSGTKTCLLYCTPVAKQESEVGTKVREEGSVVIDVELLPNWELILGKEDGDLPPVLQTGFRGRFVQLG